MRIHAELCGYHDWAPVPEGVEITKEDIARLRVKQMQDDAWHMKVTIDTPTSTELMIAEETLCRSLAARELVNKRESRQGIALEIVRKTWEHHLDHEHLLDIVVEDSGPDEALYTQALADVGITGAEATAAVARYLRPVDMRRYFNIVFNTPSLNAEGK